MTPTITLGLLGLDSSHAVRFCKVFNGDGEAPAAVSGARIVSAWAGPCSNDFDPSRTRHAGITEAVVHGYGVPLKESMAETLAGCDAALITAADPRVHLQMVREAASAAIPLFISKPLALSSETAREMFAIAERGRFPVWSSSPHRFGAGLVTALSQHHLRSVASAVTVAGRIYGAPPVPPIFWYGVHLVEMAYAILGVGCQAVHSVPDAVGASGAMRIEANWTCGRTAMLTGSPDSTTQWRVSAKSATRTASFDPVGEHDTRMEGLGQAILRMIKTGQAPVTAEEQLEIVRFMEVVEESCHHGRRVAL